MDAPTASICLIAEKKEGLAGEHYGSTGRSDLDAGLFGEKSSGQFDGIHDLIGWAFLVQETGHQKDFVNNHLPELDVSHTAQCRDEFFAGTA